jgi:hypothetical protein
MLCVLVGVLMAASVAAAEPHIIWYDVVNRMFDPAYMHMGTAKSVFYFDLQIMAGLEEPLLSPGVGLGTSLTGDLTGITANNLLNQYIPEADFYPTIGVIGPDENWAWDALAFESSNSAIVDVGAGQQLVTFQLVQGNPTGVPVSNGMVFCRMFYEWDGTGGVGRTPPWVLTQGPNPGEGEPFLLTAVSDPFPQDPPEPQYVMLRGPEPATLSLLALGLSAVLAARRRRGGSRSDQ